MSLRSSAIFTTARDITNLGGLLSALKVVLGSILAVNHSSGFVTVVLPANTTLSSSIKAQMQGTIDSFQDSVPVKSAEVQGELIVKGSFIAEQQASLSGPPARIKQVELELPPSLGNHAVTKSYAESLVVGAGTGLLKSGTTLRVNEDLPHVRSVGTVISLTSSGLVSANGVTSSGPVTITSSVDVTGDAKMSNLTVGGNMNVVGNSVFSAPMTLTAAATNPSHVVTKMYVDQSLAQAGTGLTKQGTIFSVLPSLPHVTTLGTLNSLNVSGVAIVSNASSSTDTTSGAVVIAGGMGLGGALNVGSTLNISGTTNLAKQVTIQETTQSTSTSSGALVVQGGAGIGGNVFMGGSVSCAGAVNIANTTASTSIGSGSLIISGGVGIAGSTFISTLTVTTGCVVPTPTTSTNPATKGYVDALLPTPGTGISKSGTALSVNASLSHVTSVGVLSSLSVAGSASLTTVSITNSLVVPTPTSDVHAANKVYVDGFIPVASTGMTKTGNSFSVNSTLSHVTSVGTLTGLTISGGLSVVGTSSLANVTVSGVLTVPTPASDSHAANKVYVDALLPTPGTGISKSGTALSVNASLSHVTSIGALTGLSVSGPSNFTGPITLGNATVSTSSSTGALTVAGGIGVMGSSTFSDVVITGSASIPTPTTISHAANKGYIDGVLPTVGVGLSKNATVFSVNSTLGHVTTIGTLTSLAVNGTSSFAGVVSVTNTTTSSSSTTGALTVSGGLGVNGTSSFAGVISVTNTTTSTSSSTGALTVSGGLGVNGTSSFAGLISVTNTTTSSSSTTGALTIGGGLGVNMAANFGSTLAVSGQSNFQGAVVVTGTSTFTGAVTVPTPTSNGHAATKSYIDGSVATPGTGISKSGTALSVNASLSHVTSVGTLTGLGVSGSSTISGILSVTNTTVSTSSGTGALSVSGGLGVQGSANVGGTVNVTGAVGVGTAAPVTKLHVIGDTRVQGNLQLTTAANANRIVIAPPATVNTDYVMTLPPGPPSANASYLGVNTDGSTFFDKTLQIQFFDGPLLRTGLKIWVDSVLTNGGTATVTPVTSTGTPIFTTILSVTAMPVLNTSSARNVPVCSMKTVASDNSSLTFNVVTGTSNSLSSSAAFAANGITVSVTLIGL